ncbi:LSM domain-containing protein [Methanopyrus sp. KOL6]|uniref:LSM domain-containing protein n=1 Tax=Methanopyrus sp. KOL6 TaxID=1937004 RepID=UPI000B4A9A67|nr:LSm family protein [Methanopyrus sp. KOL6]
MRPHDCLRDFLDDIVIVELKTGKTLRGKLVSFDGHLNLVLDDCVEIDEDSEVRLGRVLVRGDSVTLISPAEVG